MKSTQKFLQYGGHFVFVAICGGSSHILTGLVVNWEDLREILRHYNETGFHLFHSSHVFRREGGPHSPPIRPGRTDAAPHGLSASCLATKVIMGEGRPDECRAPLQDHMATSVGLHR